MTKQEAKPQIAKLVEKYQRVLVEGKIKSYNEAQTRNEFIEPLFEYLGWDMRNLTTDNEVTTEENVSGGRVDLAFRFNNIPAMFLEAKAMKVDLDDWKWAEQAINYSWNKSVTWAVLTDFESIKIFNAEIPPKSISQNLFIEIKCQDYVDRFNQLWLLSKESFEQKLLDKEAQKWGKLTQRKQVSEKLFEDLMSWRGLLTKDFKKQNSLTDEELDEGVQRILDRLIFIRTAEDRKIVPNVLLGISRGGTANSYRQLAKVFHDFDDGFNSKIFAHHYCEEWKASDITIAEVINGLYETKDGYRYDFSVISADVLGGMYEQYLGYVQGRKSEEKQKSARKSQGIYYTPKYIVEFIVKETLGAVLKKAKPKEIAKIKVLDPACGSGSFLIAAYDKILETLSKQNPQTSLFAKFDILKNNIFGVDLDAQAIEIAQLNLLLKVLSQKTKLPTLQHNISPGNSLVSGSAEKLEKYFGPNYREQKAFNFEDEFKAVFKQGGFDVIVGNPPYVSFYSKQSQANERTKQLLEYFINNYDFIENKDKLGRYNTLMFFLEKAMSILKNNGYLGLIVDTNIHSNPAEPIRKYISQNYRIIQLVDQIRAFEGVGSSQLILVVQKTHPKKNHNVEWKQFSDENKIIKVSNAPQANICKQNGYNFKAPKDDRIYELLMKISAHKKLQDVVGMSHIRTCITFTGKKDAFVVSNPEKEIDHPLLEGSKALSGPYAPLVYQTYVRYDTRLRDKLNEEYRILAKKENKRSPMVIGLGNIDLFKAPKIYIRLSDTRITASFTTEFFCADLSLYILTLPNNKIQNGNYYLLYLLGILNSRPVTFYMREGNYIKNLNTGTPQIRLKDMRTIPIPDANEKQQMEISIKAQTMLDLNKELHATSANTDKHNSLMREIDKLDSEIDEAVYKLYGLSKEEIKIIESYE